VDTRRSLANRSRKRRIAISSEHQSRLPRRPAN
jgi:hypothetical protein